MSVSLGTIGVAYVQDFNTLATTGTSNTLAIAGWSINETGGGARDNEQYAADIGSSSTGDTYSYGSTGSADRALGALRSGTLVSVFGASFTNNAGETIGSLDLAFRGEQWRLGTAGRADTLAFEFSTDATSLSTGTWTSIAALNFTTPNTGGTTGAKDGNAAGFFTQISGSISGLALASGQTIWIRWSDLDASGSDDGLAIDDLSLTPRSTVDTTPPSVVSVVAGTPVITDATATFTIAVTFNEAMDASGASDPVIGFPAPGENPSPSIGTPTSTSWSGSTFTATYTVADSGAAITGVDVRVTGARDLAGNQMAAHDAPDLFSIDQANPAITSSTPGDNASDVGVTAPIQITFSEPIAAAGGAIELIRTSDGAVAPSSIGVSNSVLTITPSGPLSPGEAYHVSIAAGAITDTLGNSFSGLLNSTALNFTTANAPPPPTISISPASASSPEGDTGSSPVAFSITRSDTTVDGSVQATITGGPGFDAADIASVTVDGQAIAGFTPGSPFTVNLSGAAPSTALVVNVSGDTAVEANETFTVTLSSPASGYALGSASTAAATVLNDDFTRIYDIQGSGSASAFVGQTVTIRAVVTGDFQNGDGDATRNLNGFTVQELTGDGNAATSDGLFVFQGTGATNLPDVRVGDIVTITGMVGEFNGETQISATAAGAVVVTTAEALTRAEVNALAAALELPSVGVSTNSQGIAIPDLEAFEGMLVNLPQTLTVSETFNLDRFGAFEATQGGQAYQYTQINAPSVPGFAAYTGDVARRTLTIDDGTWAQNPDIRVGGAPLTSTSTFSHGDTISNLTGVIRYANPIGTTATTGTTGEQNFRLMATEAFAVTDANPRDAAPEPVGGTLKIASFNVLNFFTSLNLTSGTDPSASGQDPRGADNNTEFDRQSQKLYQTLAVLDADIVSLIELENDFRPAGNSGANAAASAGGATAIQAIVNGLNAIVGAGVYDWVRPGSDLLGGDAIAVGMIYKTGSVSIAPGTSVARLVDIDEPGGAEPDATTADLADLGLDDLLANNPGIGVFEGAGTSRVPLAVTFQDSNGETFTLVASHFKSKGSSAGGTGDVDAGDGQGLSNNQRLEAATAITAWLATNPTGDNSGRHLIVGDLNAYAREGPIQYILDLGYANLADVFIGTDAYSYLFDGLLGTLDYGIASASFREFFTGASDWHINSDEADAFDYNTNFRPASQIGLFDAASPIRTSDHDPFVMGLDLTTNFARFSGGVFGGLRELSSRVFDTVEGSASTGDAIDVLREAALGDIGVRAIDVDNLTIRADGDVFTARFDLSGLATQLTLAGTAGMGVNGQETMADRITGNDGANRIDGFGGGDDLFGMAGDDTIIAGLGDDRADGGGGADTIFGWFGTDSLSGGSGDDILLGEDGVDTLVGAEGRDTLVGGEGGDRLLGGDDRDSLYGDAGADLLEGDGGADELFGQADGDTLSGGLGDDTLNGGAGLDSLEGGEGVDILFGFAFAAAGVAENDTLGGGGGDDILVGGRGSDFLSGGLGSDFFYWADFEVEAGDADTVVGWDAGDRLYLYAFAQYSLADVGGAVDVTLALQTGTATIRVQGEGITAAALASQIMLF
jgi:predicted extracellular nuclease